MNERALRPDNVAAAAVLIGGLLLIVLPQHAMSIVRVVIVTIAIATALYVLVVHVPPTGWISPFKGMSPFNRMTAGRRRRRRVGELDLIRSSLADRRQAIDGAPALPPAVLRMLQPLITSALDLDPRDGRAMKSARARLSPLTLAVLEADPLRRASWFRTLRADPREVAKTVDQVLDDLDLLTGYGGDVHRQPAAHHWRP